jgi:hypothetical protein
LKEAAFVQIITSSGLTRKLNPYLLSLSSRA